MCVCVCVCVSVCVCVCSFGMLHWWYVSRQISFYRTIKYRILTVAGNTLVVMVVSRQKESRYRSKGFVSMVFYVHKDRTDP